MFAKQILRNKVNEFITDKYCQEEDKESAENLNRFLSENKENELYVLNSFAKARLNEINCGSSDLVKKVFENNVYKFVAQLIMENYDRGNDDLIEHLTGDLNDDDKYNSIIYAIYLFNDKQFNDLNDIDEKTSKVISNSILRSLKLIYNKLSFIGAIDEILTYLIFAYNVEEMDDFYNELKTLPTITEKELNEVELQINELISLKMDESEN